MAGRKGKQMEAIRISRPKSLAVLVAERLREAIFRTELALGEVLSEEKIATAMNVSRTPVREALTLLQLQGLITIVPQSGSIVFKPDVQDMAELVQYRLMLETQAAPMALEHDPAGASAALERAIQMMVKARQKEDALKYADADRVFHNVFFDYCGNHYVREAYEICSGRVTALRAHLSGVLEMHRDRTFAEHQQIAEAFARGDRPALVEALGGHIGAMAGNYTRALDALKNRNID